MNGGTYGILRPSGQHVYPADGGNSRQSFTPEAKGPDLGQILRRAELTGGVAQKGGGAAGYEMTTAEQEDGDPDGPFALAAYASNNSTGAEVIWVNCGNMDNEAVYQTVPGNVTFLQGCAASLAGQEGTTLVESKALEAAPITISGHTAAVLGLVFVLILPAAVLAVGAVVVLLRRRK